MPEMVNVPAEWFAVFQHDNLPGHPANVHINHPGQPKVNPGSPDSEEIEWPEIGGVRVMPMSGRFLVRHSDGSLTPHEGGFLLIGGDGHPQWAAELEG